MAATTTNPIELSKARLAELQDSVVTRFDALKRATLHRADIAAGTVRDSGLAFAYSTAASVADGAATVTRALPLVKGLAAGLEKRASDLTSLETALQHPPIASYDELNVKQVAEKLETLGPWELEKVRRYEEEHKNRKTVLGAIDRLTR